jgi:hypothetical protein
MIFSDFTVIGFPETDDPAYCLSPRVYHNKYPAAKLRDWPHGYETSFVIIFASINFLNERAVKQEERSFKREAVFTNILNILHRIIFDRTLKLRF